MSDPNLELCKKCTPRLSEGQNPSQKSPANGGNDGTAFQVHNALRFMEHVAGPVLGATDLGGRIIGFIPILIEGLAALTFAVESGHGGRVHRRTPALVDCLPARTLLSLE